jgi:drug/metabolite transporter (DMT)-like permease
MITPFCVQLLYGLIGPLNKKAIGHIHFALYVGIKLVLAGAVLIAYYFLVQRKSGQIRTTQWWYYFQMILCGAIGAQYLKYWGLQYVSASKAAFLFNSSPFFVALFSWLRWRERLQPIQWAGLCLSFIGLLPIAVATTSTEELVGMFGIFSLPECAVLAASALHAISFTAKRAVVQAEGYASARVNGIYLFTGGIWSLGGWYYAGMPYKEGMLMTALGYAACTTFIGKIVCSTMTLYLLRYYSATFLSFMEYWYPLCVALWSWLLWGELLSYHYWLSSAIVLCGQLLFYIAMRRT